MHFKKERPWGYFEVLYEGENYKVKKLVIKPGQRTSLQKHLKRSEYLVVVNKYYKKTKIDEINKGDFFIIKKEQRHRLSNETNEDLIIIETQVGDCDENDIIRIEDDYGRIGEGNNA